MNIPTRVSDDVLEYLRREFPKGQRVQLVSMGDKIPCGTLGTVYNVDDIGTVHVNWDSGSRLGVVNGEDYIVKVLQL